MGVVGSSDGTSGFSWNCGMLEVLKLANFEFTAVVASDRRELGGRAGLLGSLDEPLSCLWLMLVVYDFFCSTFGFAHLDRGSVSVAEKYPFSVSLGEAVIDAPPLDWRLKSGRGVSELMV